MSHEHILCVRTTVTMTHAPVDPCFFFRQFHRSTNSITSSRWMKRLHVVMLMRELTESTDPKSVRRGATGPHRAFHDVPHPNFRRPLTLCGTPEDFMRDRETPCFRMKNVVRSLAGRHVVNVSHAASPRTACSLTQRPHHSTLSQETPCGASWNVVRLMGSHTRLITPHETVRHQSWVRTVFRPTRHAFL